MKIKKGFVLRMVGGENVVVPVGELCKTFHGMINLNETGAFLWKRLQDGAEEEDLVQALLNEYDVEEELARKDVRSFIDKIQGAKLLN